MMLLAHLKVTYAPYGHLVNAQPYICPLTMWPAHPMTAQPMHPNIKLYMCPNIAPYMHITTTPYVCTATPQQPLNPQSCHHTCAR